jgi:NADH-quinone oxidoreductase subunit D
MSEQTFMPSTETVFERIGENTLVVNMGPQHPSTHGVLRLICEMEGETVINIEPVIGYLHTGMEKEGEYMQYLKVVTMTDRMDYMSANGNNLVYTLAVEKLLNLEVPPRGQALRVLLCELSRIASHLVWLGTSALDLGAMTPFFWCFREREKILDMFEMFSGVRMMPSWIVPGGLRGDMPEGFENLILPFLKEFPSALSEIEGLLVDNPIWKERTIGVGVISVEDCMAYGLSGPIIRGSGLEWDIRKSNPYCGYEQYDFAIPVSDGGDVYSRFLVRLAEMRESVKILQQVMDGLPEGPWNSDNRKVVPPPREELDTSMESLIHHFKLWTEGFRVPPGEAYAAIEGPKGELGCYVVSDGSNRPYRFHMRPSSFMNLQGLKKMCVGQLIADVVAVIGSIDIVLGEIDR